MASTAVAPLLADDQRIDVDLPDPRMVDPDRPQRDEDPGDRFPVHGGRAPEAVEELLAPDAADERQRLPVRQGCDGKGRIIVNLGHHPAQTDHDAGAELRVAQEPEDQLHRFRYLFLDQDLARCLPSFSGDR